MSNTLFSKDHPRYKWVALSNTTLGILMATINSSIVIISLPAIFKGIDINPLDPANVSYLLWILMGYLLVTAVLVVTFGRLGDMFGRVRIYNLGFVVFTIGSVALAFNPLSGGHGAMWLIVWRFVQGIGGAMLFSNSTAIITDAFPSNRRGMALGINQVAAIAGSFIGLLIGGLLANLSWHVGTLDVEWVFLVSVPVGIIGTIWSYLSLHEVGATATGRMDWWGNALFAIGLASLLTAITYGIQPYGDSTEGWTNPWVLAGLIGGGVVLVIFIFVELAQKSPMFEMRLFKVRAFAMAMLAGLLSSIGRGGMQFMLIIWLQGIWLPLHGVPYDQTPLMAGFAMLPITIGFLISGPLSGTISDRVGPRLFATTGLLVVAATFVLLIVLPIDFTYWQFALLTFFNGIGSGMFAAPNRAAIMNSVPADMRGAASGMAGTVQNSGTSLSMGIFFSLLIAGLSSSLPKALFSGLTANSVPAQVATQISHLPPVSSVFAAFLGYNPMDTLLGKGGLNILSSLPDAAQKTLVGNEFFPHLISGAFHDGLVVVFIAAAAMSVVAAFASLIRGKHYVHEVHNAQVGESLEAREPAEQAS
ncbi:MAG: MFS transporter [Microbacteriaceae bacterium]|nr:MFS transporter [Microbacteriaceae bacterium]MCL2793702.1 MFS transporter [Microbacteriaceae bacterium]